MLRDARNRESAALAVHYLPQWSVEVVFQHMSSRPPFDDIELREQFRQHLDRIPGIDLPASKLQLRPSFPMEVLQYPDRRDAVIEALAWFMATARGGGGDGAVPATDLAEDGDA